MKYRTLLSLALIGAITAGSVGCRKDENLETKLSQVPVVKTINGKEYRFDGDKVKENDCKAPTEISYGVISDAHGEVEKARYFAQEFKRRGVSGIMIPGDIPLNEQLRYGQRDSRDDKTEIKEVLEAVAETGLPIFVIPGNHERKQDYSSAISELSQKFQNVIDMTSYRVFDGCDADFVSLPGYQTFKAPGRQFIPNDGYWAKPENVNQLKDLRQGLDNAVVLITHGAGKTGVPGPATLYNGEDVGDELTRQVQREANIPFGVVGHIHEAGGIAATFDGTLVKPNEWAKQFTANFGSLERWRNLNGETYNGMAGILTIKGDQAKYETLVLK